MPNAFESIVYSYLFPRTILQFNFSISASRTAGVVLNLWRAKLNWSTTFSCRRSLAESTKIFSVVWGVKRLWDLKFVFAELSRGDARRLEVLFYQCAVHIFCWGFGIYSKYRCNSCPLRVFMVHALVFCKNFHNADERVGM